MLHSMEIDMEQVLEYFVSKQVVISVAYIVAALIVVRILDRLSKRYRSKVDPKDLRMIAFIRSFFNAVKGIVLVICAFAVLQANDINITSMVTGVGVITAIAGLAFQDMFKDIIMGLHIVNDHSVVVGEVVKINGDEGVVISFSLLTTVLRSLDTGDTVIICNRNITQVAKSCGIYDIDLPLAYREDPDHVREVLTQAAADISKNASITRCEYLGIQRYEDSAVVYRIRFWCSPKVHWAMWRASMAVVQKYIIASGLEIPYTQYDIHMPDAH